MIIFGRDDILCILVFQENFFVTKEYENRITFIKIMPDFVVFLEKSGFYPKLTFKIQGI